MRSKTAVEVAAAHWLVRAFAALNPIRLPGIHDVAVDGRVLLYAETAAIATGITFGMAPALRASKPDLANELKEGRGMQRSGEFGKAHGRSVLAAAQIALSVVLLIAAGLLLRSFVARVSVPLGFRSEALLGAELPWSAKGRLDVLLERLQAIPGVEAVAAATIFPKCARLVM